MTAEITVRIDQKEAEKQLEEFRKEVKQEEKAAEELETRGRRIRRDIRRHGRQAGVSGSGTGTQGILAKIAGLQVAFQAVKATLDLVQMTTEVLAQRLEKQGDQLSKLSAKVIRSVGEVAGLGQKVAAITEGGRTAIEGAVLPFAAAGVKLEDNQVEELIERAISLRMREVDVERRRRGRAANYGFDAATNYLADKARKALGSR